MVRNLDLINSLRIGGDAETGFVWRINGLGEVSSTDEVIGAGSSISYPTSSVEWFIASTSANDTLAGTGAQKVKVTYLDENYDIAHVTVDLNGQTAVSVANGMRVLDAVVVQSGVSADFNGLNSAPLGTVHVGRGTFTSGVPASPFINIPVGKGESKTSIFTVPRGYMAFLASATISAPKNDQFTFQNWASVEGGPWVEGGSVIEVDGSLHLPEILSRAAPEKTDIQIRAISSSATAEVSSIVDLIVLKSKG